MKIIGPFTQIITLKGLKLRGSIPDEDLEIIPQGGVLVQDGKIMQVQSFESLKVDFPDAVIEEIKQPAVLIPGFVDCHTHLCFGGERSRDYAMRVAGKSYLEIAKAGGGIWDTVQQTREADLNMLTTLTAQRANHLLTLGTTTIEVKSGYGLEHNAELRMLQAIQDARQETVATLVATCLAAHMKPHDFDGDERTYLDLVVDELLPVIAEKNLAKRVDIFVEESAFSLESSREYLQKAKAMGFELTVHADQFTAGGSRLAVELGAISADHLEASHEEEINLLGQSETVAVALPGASIGLGMRFTPARALLDAGACLAIASDWNPGSAPMGDLLTQAAILGTYEKLSLAETLAGMTFRAARALHLDHDRGKIEAGKLADFQSYPTDDYRKIFYHQGQLKPSQVWRKATACL